MPSDPPMPDAPPTPELDPGPMPEPLTDGDIEIRALQMAVQRARQQGRAFLVMGFVSGVVCGALLMVLYGGL